MKKTLTILGILISATAFGQSYSTFYGTYDVNQNVNKNVKVSGTVNQNVNKTVTTIDYGALAAANAEQEANRLKAMQYVDSRDALRAKEIAADPFAALKFGTRIDETFSRSDTRKYLKGYGHGGKKLQWSFTEPSDLLFSNSGFGQFRNTSSDGVVLCEIEIVHALNYDFAASIKPKKYPPSINSLRDFVDYKMKSCAEGKVIIVDEEEHFTHKSQLGRATVYGHKGYLHTWIFETEFEYIIRDNYYAMANGIIYDCKTQYTVDKTRGSFEDLEGRRFYLRRLGEEIIATANFYYL